ICGLFFRRVPAGARLKGGTLKLETYDGQQKFAIQCNNSLHYASDVEVEITVIYHFPKVFNSCHDFVNTTADKIFSYKLISKSKRIN
ncbi:hypothetical protein, partial [Bacteroides stercoris]|uniref:hypothetical protein n=1 Tax=Bacteroides stercoris TaxID=46506 RepID=UPI00374E0377